MCREISAGRRAGPGEAGLAPGNALLVCQLESDREAQKQEKKIKKRRRRRQRTRKRTCL